MLSVGGFAFGSAQQPLARLPSIMTGGSWRCIEVPASVGVRWMEIQGARFLDPESTQSPARDIVASPRPAPPARLVPAPTAPVSRLPTACVGDDDPSCQVRQPPPAPVRWVTRMAHDGATPNVSGAVRVPARKVVYLGVSRCADGDRDPYPSGILRPPRG